jgi:hypothetical protein
VFAGYALFKTYGLAVAGRYISFPILVASIPAVGIMALIITHYSKSSKLALGFDRLLGYVTPKPEENKIFGYLLITIGVVLIFGEFTAFSVSRDFIAEYPQIAERLGWSLLYTLTNAQLLEWLACLGVIALPLINYQKTDESLT